MHNEITSPTPLGSATQGQALKENLATYRELALAEGASDAVIISADEVVVDERVRLKCLVPRCLRAGETPNCPPHAPDLDLVRQAFSRYRWAILLKCDVAPIEAYAPSRHKSDAERRQTLRFHQQSNQVICALEKRAYQDGYPLAMGLGGGSCKDYLCQGMLCQFLDSGRCRFPHRARPAMEAMGIDVVSLIEKVGWQSYALLGDLESIPCAITVGIVFIV